MYLAAFSPEGVEWIDDDRCNVVFRSEEWASKCLLQMSKPLKVRFLRNSLKIYFILFLQRVRTGPIEDGEMADSDTEERISTEKKRDGKREEDEETTENVEEAMEVDKEKGVSIVFSH